MQTHRRHSILRRLARWGATDDQRAELERIESCTDSTALAAALSDARIAELALGDEATWRGNVASAVAVRLSELDGVDARSALRGLLQSEHRDIRSSASSELCDAPSVEDKEAFVAALEDDDSGVRSNAMHALSALGAADAVPAIERISKTGSVTERATAGRALRALRAR
jgi:HEAT repeat protein